MRIVDSIRQAAWRMIRGSASYKIQFMVLSLLFQATDNTIWCLKFVFKIWKLVDIIFPTLYFLREIGHVTPSCNGPTFVLIENASILF